jgi:cellulose biosynthesis protein BcsQ
MTGKVIAIANMKGGVGKTATVIGLVEALAVEGHKVLVIDLDSQASASFCLTGDDELKRLIDLDLTIESYIRTNIDRLTTPLKDFVKSSVSNVYDLDNKKTLDISLVPSNTGLRFLERDIVYDLTAKNHSMNAIEGRMAKMLVNDLSRLCQHYDFIVFDCAPGISAFNEVAIKRSDLVIVPTIPDMLSTLGLAAFCKSVWQLNISGVAALARPKRPPWVLASIFRPTVREHQVTYEDLRREAEPSDAPFRLFNTKIAQSPDIPKALSLFPGNPDIAFPTYTRKWGAKVISQMDDLKKEVFQKGLKGA